MSTNHDVGNCRVCGHGDGQGFVAHGFGWLRCTACRTIQKDITRDEYHELNPSYDPGHFLDSKDREQIEQYLDVAGARRFLARIVDERLPATASGEGTFLDVGCGMGRYLLAARELGFSVLGFEPSDDHARVAVEHFGLDVIGDYFSVDQVAGRTFNLIMLSHVIEHIYEPRQFIHELVSVLKPGGVLAIVTPNSEGLVAAMTRGAWTMLKTVDHVTLISRHAYDHFDLDGVATVEHHTSEYPFEFAAALLSSMKTRWLHGGRAEPSGQQAAGDGVEAPSPLRRFGMKTRLLRSALSLASLPAHWAAIATDRQACLNTLIVRKS
jgi:2-polyprenyl-3-methyl-5-hydroxy-6-metoxy-1,4-benzoquinol methylase